MFRSRIRERSNPARLIALAGLLLPVAAALADPIAAFKLEFPFAYIQAGLEWNPAIGGHPFLLPPPGAWATPQTLTFSGGSVGTFGSSTHMIALHPPETAPAVTWSYSFSSSIPSGFGARETRVRRAFIHPGGSHVDAYMGVVGAIVGTAPGAPVGPNLVMLGGSIGRHTNSPPPPAPQPIYCGSTLKPRSGLPSPGNMDYPAGELLTIIEMDSGRCTMLLVVDGMQTSAILNVFVRQGLNGPNLIDLRPQMQVHPIGQYDTAMVIADAPLPFSVTQAIAAGTAYMSVRFSPIVHPDGEILGQIVQAPCPADFNQDGQVDFFDYLDFVQAYDANDPAADFNGDGQVDFFDYLDFAQAYDGAC